PPERDAAEIVRLLDRATELARGCGGTIYEPSILETRAALARASGQAAEAERELREALRLYAEFGATGHAERLARELPAEPENAVACGGPGRRPNDQAQSTLAIDLRQGRARDRAASGRGRATRPSRRRRGARDGGRG